MKKLLLLVPVLALSAALLSGCGKSGSPTNPASPPPSSDATDQAAISAEAANQPDFVEDGLFESPDQMSLALGAPDGANAAQSAVRPITFWRHITDVERRFEFAFADTDTSGRPTTAIMTMHKYLSGTFNILVPDTTGAFNRTVITKPLADHWLRRLLFKRVPVVSNHFRPAWRLAATSGVKVTSRGNTAEIASLRLEGSGRDTTFYDPLAFFRLHAMLNLDPNATVKLTVTTGKPDDVVLLLTRHNRFRLKPNGDNTYTGYFKVPVVLGVHHLGVNALSNGTLFDNDAPYDSQAWLLPYIVTGTQVAADMP
jgi:hypothetical protein